MPLGVFLFVGLKNRGKHRTYRASDLVLGCVLDVSRVLNAYKTRTSGEGGKGGSRKTSRAFHH